jgi:predicted amidophosphoribosyltransferase
MTGDGQEAAMLVILKKDGTFRAFCSDCGQNHELWFQASCNGCGKDFADHIVNFDVDPPVLSQPDGWSEEAK